MMKKQTRPLIGILSVQRSDGSLAGNRQLFRKLQKKLNSLGGLSFVFTPGGVHQDLITGYTYSDEEDCWIKNQFPYPELVYNRIPYRKAETLTSCQTVFSALEQKGIPYFNPCFLNKKKIYEVLKNHPGLKTYLPETITIQEEEDLRLFLEKHPRIYLKPASASKGKGILRLQHISAGQLILEGITKRKDYPTLAQFWEQWRPKLTKKSYLAQVDINPAEFEGKRYDLRILAHADNDRYVLTGVGVRQSQGQDITTHTTSGGRLLPYELLQCKSHDQFMESVIPLIGNILSRQFGFFGEFSIDAGVSKTGQYYIYEINSKPMEFDESDIEEKKLDQLCRLFFQLTNCSLP